MEQTAFICPVCRLPLEPRDTALCCADGHSFDRARAGYVNLIPSKATGRLQGDSASMVKARQGFLTRGLYLPLAQAVTEAMLSEKPQVVADIGCGEGYYLRELLGSRKGEKLQAYGMDISKAAVAAAAKASPGAHWGVADTNSLIPLGDASVEAAMCVFAPRNAVEFARVVRPGGRLVVAIPGPAHLASLREKFELLAIESDKASKISGQLLAFDLLDGRKVATELELDHLSLRELLDMTPNARHVDETTRVEIAGINRIRTEAHFEVLTFIRQ